MNVLVCPDWGPAIPVATGWKRPLSDGRLYNWLNRLVTSTPYVPPLLPWLGGLNSKLMLAVMRGALSTPPASDVSVVPRVAAIFGLNTDPGFCVSTNCD